MQSHNSAASIEVLEDRTLLALFLVNTGADTVDVNPGDGFAFDANNRVSLRAAIMEANALAGADSIVLPKGIHTLTIAGVFEDLAATGDLDITDELTIAGAGADLTTIDGNGIDRVFDVAASTTVNFYNVTITGGQAVGDSTHILEDRGGGIRIDFFANVLVAGVTLIDNSAPRTDMGSVFGLGGAIESAGSLTIIDSRLENNLATNSGGAIYSAGTGASLNIERTTFVGNSARDGGAIENHETLIINTSTFSGNDDNGSGAGNGGAINNNFGGSLTLTNSTLSGNDADLGGGLINFGTATIQSSTFTENTGASGGGILHAGASLIIENSIVAGNTVSGTAHDVDGTVTSSGHNLIGDTTGSTGFGAAGDLLNVPAMLGPLADNGGATLTHALLVGSQAIDNANNATAPATDQRGVARPINGTADIGAFERQPAAVTYVVDSLLDENDGVHTAGNFSLREAIALSNASSSSDIIEFDPSLAGGTIVLANALRDYDITDDVTISGLGAGLLTIDAHDNSRVFTIDGVTNGPIEVTISGLTLIDGLASGASPNSLGGAIYNEGAELTLADSEVLSSRASRGGAIYSVGASPTVTAVVNIVDTTLTGNSTGIQGGGAIFNDGNVLMTVTRSALSGNTSSGTGGGISATTNYPSGIYTNISTLRIVDSTLSGNTTTGFSSGGGAIRMGNGTLIISGSTFSGNSATSDGGAIAAQRGTVDVTNSTFSGNSAEGSSGAIHPLASRLTINASTIVGNRADSDNDSANDLGGGINTPFSGPESFTFLNNTIVAGNVSVAAGVDVPDDLSRKPIEPGATNNLIGDAGSSAGLTDGVAGNIVGNAGVGTITLSTVLDPVLASNGGPTETHALVTGSLAIDAADPGDSPPTDQRGVARPQGPDSDIGAFEIDVPLTLTIDLTSISENGGMATGTVTRLGTSGELIVYLVSHDTSEATVPASVTILNGNDSATFPITGVDDAALDGTQTVAITASTATPMGNPMLDPSFGTGGTVITTLGQTGRPVFHSELDIQPDGKILAIGRHPTINTSWIVSRFNPDGSPDMSFGTGGSVTTDLAATNARPEGIIQHPDGRITVVGISGVALFARYLPDGTPDPSFGTSGIQKHNLPGQVYDGVTNDDGTMFLAGRQGGRMMLVKLAADGSLDTSYGTGGIFTPDLGPANNETAERIDRQSDGRIIVSGTGNGNLLAVRFTTDGALDTSFGTSGFREVSASGAVATHSDRGGTGLVIQPDDRIVLAASFDGGASGDDWVVTRLTSGGNLDTSFGVSGLREIDFNGFNDIARDVVRTPSGHLVVVGSAAVVGSGFDRAMVVLDPDGDPETAFGAGGSFILPPLPEAFEVIFSAVVQPDGKLLTFSGRSTDLRLERHIISSGFLASATIDVTDDEVPLIGIDFGGGTLPTNWTQVNGTTTDFTLTDLIDESGNTTNVDAFIDFDGAPSGYINFAPPAGELPAHTQSLAGLDESYVDSGSIIVTFQDLTPGQVYEVYVFGGDTVADTQQVTITGTSVTQFSYMHGANQLFVNQTVGSNAALETFVELVAADASGNIQVQVDSTGGSFFGLAGLALRPSNVATELTVTIDLASISENGGMATGTVTRNGTSGDLMVSLLSDDTTEATVPAMVMIPDGAASAMFPITGVDDPIVDGTQMVTVTASAAGLTDGADTLDVTDDDVAPVTFIVDTLVDESDGDFSAGDLSLREAIEFANVSPGADTITFDPSLSGGTITLGGTELLITDDVTITGLGASQLTLSGGSASRIFHVDGGPIDVEIVSLTLTGGTAIGQLPNQDGGALVNVGGNVTLADLVVTTNLARFGGAFASSDGTLTITDSTISNNTATVWGGAISNLQADVFLTRVVLDNNSAINAGAMYANGTVSDRANVTLVDTDVTNHSATDFGGAFDFSARVTFIATDSLFSGNQVTGASGLGGVMLAQMESDITFIRSEISNNTAGGVAGGLAIIQSDLRLEQTTVANNTATTSLAGGIAFSDAAGATGMTIVGSTISGNTTGTDGGGLWIEGGVHAIINSTISGNSAAGVGGAFEDFGATIVIRSSTITGNRADSDGNSASAGGGIFLTNAAANSATTLHNTIVAGNVTGMSGADAPDDVNTATGATLVGTSSHNLIGDAATSGGLADGANGNIVGNSGAGTLDVTTVLDTMLTDNGGPTLTHTLVTGSPAIDNGSAAQALDADGNSLDADQRFFVRTIGATVDIGAVEFASVPLPAPTATALIVNGAGNLNRSGVAALAIGFDQAVTVSDAGALTLFNHTTGQTVLVPGATLENNVTAAVTWNLNGFVLPDGRYTAELPATSATNITNLTLARSFSAEFHVLRGDVSGDGRVNATDFIVVDANFDPLLGTPFRPGDGNGDGRVNASDFIEVDANFNPLLLAPLAYDFGDAPETGTAFPTTLASDGARHVITGNSLFLGADRDAEADGQPDATASGDGADEDGIDVSGNLLTGTSVAVTVTSSGAGFVNGWVDFNQDGDWDDPGEQVFTDAAVAGGANNLQIAVPAGATLGSTFVRFRLTGTAGYSYFGLAPDGEVEDYQLLVADPPADSADSFTQETFTPPVLTTLPLWWTVPPSSTLPHSLITFPARPSSLFGHSLSLFSTGRPSRVRGR